MKNWRVWICLVAVMVFCAVALGCAAAEPEKRSYGGLQVSREEDGITTEEAAEGYVRTKLGLMRAVSLKRDSQTTSKLSEAALRLYNLLKPVIAEVAAGDRESTEFTFPVRDIFDRVSLSASDLGLDSLYDASGNVSKAAEDAFYSRIMPECGKVMSALLMDCPYELYWFDKTRGMYWSYPYYMLQDDKLSLWGYDTETFTLSFTVAKEYSKTNQSGTFKVDTSKGAAVQAAAANAKQIISNNSHKTDYQKLKGYKDAICDLVDYNTAAVDDTSTPYGNPWQLVWIFDGDPATKVVCEGYSKGFQYLCDMTSFSGSVSCVSFYGRMNGGAHMWNLVTINGERYMADITNCDDGSVGYPDLLFLKGYSSKATDGSGNPVYYYDLGFMQVYYVYDEEIADLVPASEMTISDNPEGFDDTVAEGTCGTLEWKINAAGELWISGEGAVPAYGSGMWDKSLVTKVILDEGITGIGSGAFTGCAKLTEIWLPKTLSSIPEDAFDARSAQAEDPRTFYIKNCGLTTQVNWITSHNLKYVAQEHANLVNDPDKAATCTEPGWENKVHCTVCGYSSQTDLPIIPHSWDEGTITREPGYTVPGIRTYTCTMCGLTRDEEIYKKIYLGQSGWIHYADGSWSYGDENGDAAIGPWVIDGAMYGFNEQGKLFQGWAMIDGKWYYAGADWTLYHDRWLQAGNDWYYFRGNGEMATGWLDVSGARYYMGSGALVTGWIQENGNWYFLKASGELVTGWLKYGNLWYYMGADGALMTGWIEDGGVRYYMGTDGALKTGWIQDNGQWYYIYDSGALATGWIKSGNNWYYMDGTGALVTGWVKDGEWYYMGIDGALKTGWTEVNGYWFYLQPSGAMKTGWLQYGGRWYYFRPENGTMVTGEQVIDGQTWTFGDDGALIY